MSGKPTWIYRGKECTIHWAGASFICLVISIGFFLSEIIFLNLLGCIFLFLSICAGYFEYIERREKKRQMQMKTEEVEDVKPKKYNLKIKIICSKATFEKTKFHSREYWIEQYGMTIYKTKKILEGNWIIDDDGVLERGVNNNLETYSAQLDISCSLTELLKLICAFDNNTGMSEEEVGPDLHFDGGKLLRIKFDGKNLYLD